MKNQIRSKKITVRFNTSETEILLSKSNQLRISPSTFLRNCALDYKMKVPLQNDEDKQLFRHVASMSNNLNQLTKKAHKEGLFTVSSTIIQTIKDLELLLNKLH